MKELHLKEGVLTGEECMEVYTSRIAPGVWTDSNLILILATKPKEQCELAMTILKSSSIWYLHRKLPLLSKLYQCHLITGGDVEEMKNQRGDLVDRIVLIQCCKEANTVNRTLKIMNTHYFETWTLFKILSELYQNKLITREEVQEMMRSDLPLLKRLTLIQCHKCVDVVSQTAGIMSKYGIRLIGKQLRILSELYGSKLTTKEEVEENFRLLKHEPLDKILVRIQYRKGADVVSKTADIAAKHGFTLNHLKVPYPCDVRSLL
jgi:hypothetical protein